MPPMRFILVDVDVHAILLGAGRAQQRIERARRERDKAICDAYAAGASLHAIARATGITRSAVRNIVRREQERFGGRLNPLRFGFEQEPTTEAERKLVALVEESKARAARGDE
jgi:hypothetical protein